MKQYARAIGMAVAGIMLLGMVCMAQAPEPPFTWKGEGLASFIGEEGTTDLEFNVKINIDVDGAVTGETSTDEGSSPIKQLYYGEQVGFDFPPIEARRLTLVIMIGDDSDQPGLVIMSGHILVDKFWFGELFFKPFEAGGSIEKGLDIGNNIATAIDQEYLPQGLNNALNKCIPIGCFKVTGGFATD